MPGRPSSPTTRAAIVAAAILAADQATKVAVSVAASGNTAGLLVPTRNHDFSLGVLSAPLPVMLTTMAVGIAAVGTYLFRVTARGQVPAWATGLLVGGALSNFADRFVGGSVRDFLATPWVVLNLADVAVIAGLAGWLAARHRSSRRAVDREATAGAS